MAIQVVNFRDIKAQRKPNVEVVYIGRKSSYYHNWMKFPESPLGNPFHLNMMSRTESIEKYKAWLKEKLSQKGPKFQEINRIRDLAKMKEVWLVCWCKPLPCHGDVIKKVVEET